MKNEKFYCYIKTFNVNLDAWLRISFVWRQKLWLCSEMERHEIVINSDAQNLSWSVPVLTFAGNQPEAPKVYIQAGLHADELPGIAVAHYLSELLRQAEKQNAIAGDITLVPMANPIGINQWDQYHMTGRLEVASGVNFNRNFELVKLSERDSLLEGVEDLAGAELLKRHLLSMALEADIVVDQHCDSESLLYTYCCEEFWPHWSDFAAALELDAVFLADGKSSAFEEAVAFAWRESGALNGKNRFSATLELRGMTDVDEKQAQSDAAGLMKFLTGRGVIAGAEKRVENWNGVCVPLDNIEMINAPKAGVLLFARNVGDVVAKGDLLARIITEPGSDDGMIEVLCPQAGLIITRIRERYMRRGDNFMKIACEQPSDKTRTPGALEG